MKFQDFSNQEMKAERVASCAQMSGESSEQTSPAPPLSCDAVVEVLHDLNNAFTAVLINAQVLECKLPSYSRSKRYIHEIERGAQRGSALLKRLLGHIGSGCSLQHSPASASREVSVSSVAEPRVVVATHGLPPIPDGEVLSRGPGAAPVLASIARAHMKV